MGDTPQPTATAIPALNWIVVAALALGLPYVRGWS
jgi:hypothetical protein